MNVKLLAVLAAGALAFPRAASATLDDGLVAHYSFDDCTATDVSGHGNDGTPSGGVSCAPGQQGSGLKFGGVFAPGSVTVPATPSLSAVDGFTYSLWFRIDGYTSMGGYGQITDYGLHALFAKEGDRTGLDLRTSRSPETGLLYLWASNGYCCGLAGRASPPFGAFGLGEWHMATITMGGGVLGVYFDGALQATMPAADFNLDPAMAAQPLRLGIDEGGWWYPLDGMLDEVRVYARALSAAEVGALFRPVQFGGFLPPVRGDGAGLYKQGSTIPVKFQLADALTGAPITDAVARLLVAKVAEGVAGTFEAATSTSAADVGNQFRFDPVEQVYVFNLSTKPLDPGATYELTVELDGGQTFSTLISLK